MISLQNYNNADSVVIKLLKYLLVSVDKNKIVKELEIHPDYPSLLSISDVLNTFNIPNVAFQEQFENLDNIPRPFSIIHFVGSLPAIKIWM